MERRNWPTNDEWNTDRSRKLFACELLLQIADELTDRKLRPEPMVAFEEWARATKTFRASGLLASRGYGQQAQVLARCIFESAMLVLWAIDHPREAEERARLHGLLALDLHLAARRRTNLWPNEPTKPFLTPLERRTAVQLFGRRGTGYWSGHRQLESLVTEVVSNLADSGDAFQVRAMHEVMFGWANRMTHVTGLTGFAYRSEDPDEPDVADDTQVLITGPSRHQVFDALQFAASSYQLILIDFIERFAPEYSSECEKAGGMLWRAWKDPSELESLSDSDPCPCDRADAHWGDCHKWTEELRFDIAGHVADA
jgi:hypothetical protein